MAFSHGGATCHAGENNNVSQYHGRSGYGAVPSPTRPLTGAEYLESLRDGREIWLYGERVKDVTTHPAFRNTACMIARLYDALHDPAYRRCSPLPQIPAPAGIPTATFGPPVPGKSSLRHVTPSLPGHT